MRQWIFMLSFLLSCGVANAQHSIRGQVTDRDNEPLTGAHISLKNTFLGTVADENGNYSLKKLSPGVYTLTVTFIGYETQERTVELNADLVCDFQMEPAPFMADEVVVRSTRAGSKDPVTHTNLRPDELPGRSTARDIPMLLNLTPSLVSTSDAGTGIGYTSLRIRGTDGNRINVTVNGIPFNDAESHGVFWVDLPDLVSSLENVQIQRGVGTSSNGAGAFGATINLQTYTLEKEAYAVTSAGTGSFGTRNASLKFGTGLIRDRFTFDGRISRIYSDGFVDRAFANLKSFSLSGGMYSEKNILRFNIIHGWEETYQAWAGVPREALNTNRTYNPYNYENEIDHYDQTHYQLIWSGELMKAMTVNASLHYTRGLGYYEQYQDTENPYQQTAFSHYGLENVVLGEDTLTHTDLVRRLWLDNHFYGLTYSLQYRLRNTSFVLGGSWNRYLGDHYGRLIWARFSGEGEIRHRWYLNTGDKRDFNLFAKANLSLNSRLNLFADLQYRTIAFSVDGSENGLEDIGQEYVFHFFNPKAGVFYSLSDREEAYLSLAVGQREPNRDNFVDAQAAGNKPPVEEKLYDLESGYRFRTKNLSLSVSLYYMYYIDQLVTTGEINYVGAPVMTNVPRSYRTGIETEAGGRLGSRITWNLNATLSRNRILDFKEKIELYDDINTWNFTGYRERNLGATFLSFSPGFTGSGSLGYSLPAGLSASLISRYVSRQYIDNTSNQDRSVDPYFVNDLKLAWEGNISRLGECEISLMFYNLLNHEYETHAWVYRAAFETGDEYTEYGFFPQAGRHFMLSARWSF